MTFSVESVVEKTSHGQPDPHRSGWLAGKEDVLYVEGLLKKQQWAPVTDQTRERMRICYD